MFNRWWSWCWQRPNGGWHHFRELSARTEEGHLDFGVERFVLRCSAWLEWHWRWLHSRQCSEQGKFRIAKACSHFHALIKLSVKPFFKFSFNLALKWSIERPLPFQVVDFFSTFQTSSRILLIGCAYFWVFQTISCFQSGNSLFFTESSCISPDIFWILMKFLPKCRWMPIVLIIFSLNTQKLMDQQIKCREVLCSAHTHHWSVARIDEVWTPSSTHVWSSWLNGRVVTNLTE